MTGEPLAAEIIVGRECFEMAGNGLLRDDAAGECWKVE